MLSQAQRLEPYPSKELIGHLRGERGKKHFSHYSTAKERYSECKEAILNPNIGAIVCDGRESMSSTHQCLFVNGCGENIALSLGITDDGKITMITLKNIAESLQNPKWFYDEYQKIAETRDMPSMERKWRPN